MPGETLSGFTVNITTESIPDAVDFFAFGLGDEYNLPDAFYSSAGEGGNASYTGFEVIVGSPVPEPSTFILFGVGLASLAFAVRRRKKE